VDRIVVRELTLVRRHDPSARSAMEAVVQPETRYARLGEDRIAYQVLGEGPPDLVMTTGNYSHVDMVWEDPGIALFLRTLASFSRLIVFDRRGTGASDPRPPGSLPPWESYAQDLTVVLDEVGSEQAALLAQLDASPMALFFAGTRPERTRALILANAAARFLAADDYPIGVRPEVAEALLAQFDQLWGTEAMAAMFAPSRAGDHRFCRWFARYQRAIASPRAVQAFLRANLEMDARPILPLIQAPTLVLHRRDYQFIPIANGRYLAEHIPGARLVELAGTEQSLFWENPELALDQVERFLTGVRRGTQPTRMLATVLFTDIVGSTRRAGELGDRRWRELLNVHDELTGRLVEEFGGRLVKTTGDGVLATFDGPGRAIHCAVALREELAGIGIQLRAGLHTGEVELRGDDVGGFGGAYRGPGDGDRRTR
jgi:pimeloyl-ACP methyl ester carboxylesterase